ncbi:HAMP domain-containing methyl-accepting chemotaxis protein [uncultured Cohaesibacter sp.]|uniref:methyl-accepting chemotaxis protein n=1 Tax=uncultured Cohaesibacter sp. TaxID=1002546 RepID=UPI0029C7873A|nr:HAMP domain-containing methyl-accepting chemotaxis protein [uncultured Cohaesibacter sp.]
MSVSQEALYATGGGKTAPGSIKPAPRGLKRLKIGHRIVIGFMVVLLILVGLAFTAIQGLQKLNANFESYGDLSGDAIIASQLQTQLVNVQLAAREYMSSPTDKNVERFENRYSSLLGMMETAHTEIHHAERVVLLKQIDQNLGNYKQGFERLVQLMTLRNKLVYETLSSIGNDINQRVDKVDQLLASSGNIALSQYAGKIRETMLLARLSLMKFVDDNRAETIAAAFKYLEDLNVADNKLRSGMISNELVGELAGLSQRVDDYKREIETLHNTIDERNTLREETLDQRSSEILAAAEKIASTVSADTSELEHLVTTNFGNTNTLLLIASAVAVAIGLGCALVISRGITKPVVTLTWVMKDLANDKLEVDVPGKERGDELGEMASAVEVFKQNAIRTKQLEAEQVEHQKRTELEKREMMGKMANDFNEHIGSIIDTVSSASEELSSSAKSMSDVSEQTERQVAEASAASAQTSGNVQTVATATEEMTSTIGEISVQVQQASHSAREAVSKVDATNQMMDLLASNSNKIGEVVEMISQIAEQTNLLALNATIESARAGEAGKGFAVVAGEVKALAGQTAKATDEIAQQINEIQAATEKASVSMQDVSQVIQRLDEFTAAIASAMEQQNAATGEISNSIHQAAQGTEIVDNSIASVSRASQEAATASSHVMKAASELAKQSDFLKTEVQRFIEHVRES